MFELMDFLFGQGPHFGRLFLQLHFSIQSPSTEEKMNEITPRSHLEVQTRALKFGTEITALPDLNTSN
jgi:hypothetical protein